jgi:hypothetical protein
MLWKRRKKEEPPGVLVGAPSDEAVAAATAAMAQLGSTWAEQHGVTDDPGDSWPPAPPAENEHAEATGGESGT